MNVCNMMHSLWSNKKISLKKDISVIQKYVIHTSGRLPLLPVFGTIFQNIQKFGSFWVFQGIFRPAFRTNIYDV